MAKEFVNPVRNFVDNQWATMRLIIDNSFAKGDNRKTLYDRYGGGSGVEFRDLNGPINGALLTLNNSICAPSNKIAPYTDDKINTLKFWAYPNGEFTPVKLSQNNNHYQNFTGNGNPNGGIDHITLQPTQSPNPTIPVFPQPNSPNINKTYASYRSISSSSNNTDWSTPQYYRSAYNASDMQCAISSKNFVKTLTGPRGDFPLLQFQNGYKLLASDQVTVVKVTDPGDGTNIVVTCNPGIGPRDSSSVTYVQTMTNYCGNGDSSFYKDSRYNAFPNASRQDEDGNTLGYGTLTRFDSPICRTFCTQYPLACKRPFQQWCSNINNWTPQGTCYATANIVKADQQDAVVPTLYTLCQDKNLDTNVCKTFCFQNNTSNLNCGPALKTYCGGLVRERLRTQGQLTISQPNEFLNASVSFNLNTEFTVTDTPNVTPFNTGESVTLQQLTPAPSPVIISNYGYINFKGYITNGVVTVSSPAGINITFHGPPPIRLATGTISGTNYNLQWSLGTGQLMFVGQEIYIYGGTTANSIAIRGFHIIRSFVSSGGPPTSNYTLGITLPSTTVVTTGALDADLIFTQPYVYGPDGKFYMPFNRAAWVTAVAPNVVTNYTQFQVIDPLANVGTVNYPVQLEVNVFNYILNTLSSQIPPSAANKFQLAIKHEQSGVMNAAGVKNTVPYYFFDAATNNFTFRVSAVNKLGVVVTQPFTGTSSNPYLKKYEDGIYVSYSNDAVANAAAAVYATSPQCPCFMPTFVYAHYYDSLLNMFPSSPQLNAFIQNIVTKPFCTYPQCAIQNNGATNYSPRVFTKNCPDVAYCLANAEISIENVGYLARTNFQTGDPNDLDCNIQLSTFSIYQDTRLLSVASLTTSFYNVINNNVNNSIIDFQLARATPPGNTNIPVIPPIKSRFYGFITGRTLIACTRVLGTWPPDLPSNTASVYGRGNNLFGQGIRADTFIDPAVPMIPYAGYPGFYQYSILGTSPSQTVGSLGRQIEITIQGDAVPTLYPCKATYFVNNARTQSIQEYPYMIGDKIHVYESDVWQTFQNYTPTPITGFIAADPNDVNGGSILTVITNNGPVCPGLMVSTNGVLAQSYIRTLLTGNGTPYANASTWKLSIKYPNGLGSAANPVLMYVNGKSVLRYVSGYIKDIYTNTVGAQLFTYISLECEDTNEDPNQLRWSNTSSDIRTLNSSGQLALVYSIARDKDDSETPGGQPINDSTWEKVYKPDPLTGIENQPIFDNKIVKESSATVLIIIVVVISLVIALGVGFLVIRRKNGVLKNLHKEKVHTERMNTEMKTHMNNLMDNVHLVEPVQPTSSYTSKYPSEI